MVIWAPGRNLNLPQEKKTIHETIVSLAHRASNIHHLPWAIFFFLQSLLLRNAALLLIPVIYHTSKSCFLLACPQGRQEAGGYPLSPKNILELLKKLEF